MGCKCWNRTTSATNACFAAACRPTANRRATNRSWSRRAGKDRRDDGEFDRGCGASFRPELPRTARQPVRKPLDHVAHPVQIHLAISASNAPATPSGSGSRRRPHWRRLADSSEHGSRGSPPPCSTVACSASKLELSRSRLWLPARAADGAANQRCRVWGAHRGTSGLAHPLKAKMTFVISIFLETTAKSPRPGRRRPAPRDADFLNPAPIAARDRDGLAAA